MQFLLLTKLACQQAKAGRQLDKGRVHVGLLSLGPRTNDLKRPIHVYLQPFNTSPLDLYSYVYFLINLGLVLTYRRSSLISKRKYNVQMNLLLGIQMDHRQ